MNGSVYQTKQKQLISDFLSVNSDKSFTVEQIVDMLKANNNHVGKTTVYRYIDCLLKSGKVRKFTDGKTKSASYQYLINHESCSQHMHLKCTECGKLIHLSCDFMSGVSDHISKHHNFTVDNSKTTIFGICENCSNKN